MVINMERAPLFFLIIETATFTLAFIIASLLYYRNVENSFLFIATFIVIELLLYVFLGRTFLGTQKSWEKLAESMKKQR